MTASDVPLGDLLLHAEFVRGLARDLAADEAAADDLTQESWLRALQRPPRHDAALRGWFATLVANVWRNGRRAAERRRRRERLAGAPVGPPSPESILEREFAREQLVRALLRLQEPFRSVLLLRYYEDLPPAAIARQLGVPAATVRTRLWRGLEQLRRELAPVLAPDGAPASVRSPRPAFAALGMLGALAMKQTLATAAVVVLALAAALAFAFGEFEPAAPPPPAEGGAEVAAGTAGAGGDLPTDAVDASDAALRVAAVLEPIEVEAPRTFPAERGVGALFGTLVDVSERPVAGVEVVAEPIHGTLPPLVQLTEDRALAGQRAVTDELGHFQIAGVPGGPTRVRAELTPDETARATVVVAADRQNGPIELRAGRGALDGALRIVVVDTDGAAVADAAIEVYAWSAREDLANALRDPRREPIARGRSDGAGECTLRGLRLRSGFVYATTADGRIGQNDFDLRMDREAASGLRVRVAPAGRLRGRLTGVDAADLAGAVVSAHALVRAQYANGGSRCFDAAVVGDAFEFEALPAGRYGFTLAASAGVRLVTGRLGGSPDGSGGAANSAEMPTVDVAVGATVERDLAVARGPVLEGRVASAGRPIAGARVRAVLAPRSSNYTAGFVLRGTHVWRFDGATENAPFDPLTHVLATTDAAGRYRFATLQPGAHRVEVVANGFAFERRMDVELTDGEVVELEHELVPGGLLQIAAIDLGYVGVTRIGDTVPAMLAIVNRDFVTFGPLAPGRYEIARFHSNAQIAPRPLGVAEVVAGRTTYVDLRHASVGAVLTGRVTAAGAPIADARFEARSRGARTGPNGEFRLELASPVRLGAGVFTTQLAVRVDGVVSRWVPAEVGDFTALDLAIDLGDRRVAFAAVDAAGLPAPVHLRLGCTDSAAASGLVGAGIDAELPASGRTFGPLPRLPMTGEAVYADGLRVPLALAADATELVVERGATATLRVRVTRAGAPFRGMHVFALRWNGEGPAPLEDERFGAQSVEYHEKTGDDGVAELTVPPGDYLVNGNALLGPAAAVRVRVGREGTATELVVK